MDTQTSTDTRDVARFRSFLKTGAPGPHAYTVLLGLEYFDLPNVLKAVEKGFSFGTFERLVRNMNVPSDRLAEIVGIPRRTLARRKIEGRFTAEESERLLRGARVFALTLRLFDGDRDAAVDWLLSLQIALGKAPADLIHTEVGARDVERVIGALEHGVFL
ncbi:MAG TPA: antitoxin Xre-like helix-turn-helix domain-containing protein [Thermoanaerobaculia bacterium]|nr:antitoxin Xre-like helix-turn-helix domain-containing protein [Thermoanaerobaculia bacterium]